MNGRYQNVIPNAGPGRAMAGPAHDYAEIENKWTRTTAGRHRVNNRHCQPDVELSRRDNVADMSGR